MTCFVSASRTGYRSGLDRDVENFSFLAGGWTGRAFSFFKGLCTGHSEYLGHPHAIVLSIIHAGYSGGHRHYHVMLLQISFSAFWRQLL